MYAKLLVPLLFCGVACSQEQDLFALSLEELQHLPVYSISRGDDELWSSAAAITVITRDQIARSAAISLADLLRQVPGFYVRTMNSEQQAVSSRNDTQFYLSNLLLLIDGQNYSPVTTNAPFFPQIEMPLELIERIEIVRGAGSPVWGSNTAGGVINVITRRVVASDPGALALALGSFDFHRQSAQLSLGNSAQRVRIAAQQSEDNGYNQDYPLHSMRRVLDIDYEGELEQWRWGLTAQRVRLRDDEPYLLDGVVADNRINGSNWRFNATWQNADNELSVLSSRNKSNTYFRVLGVGVDSDDHEYDASFRRRHDALKWLVGINQRDVQLHLTPSALIGYIDLDPFYQYRSAYSLLQWQAHAEWSVDGSVRREHHLPTDQWVSAWGLRSSWQPARSHSLWLSRNRGFQQPNQSHNNTRGIISVSAAPPLRIEFSGRADLHAEQVDDWQFGWRWSLSDQRQFDLSIFNDRYQGQIYLDVPHPEIRPGNPTVVTIYHRNHINTRSRGGEWKLSQQWRDCRASLAWSYFSEINRSQSGAKVSAPTYAPSEKWTLSGDCEIDAWSGSLALTHENRYRNESAGGLYAAPESYRTIAAHYDLDLSVRYALSRQWSLQLLAQHLLMREPSWIYNYGYAPETEITPRYWLSLRYQW